MTKRLPVWMALCTFVLAANALPKLEARAGQDPNGYRLTWDDFRNGFDATSPAAKWFYFAAGPFVGDDGIATTSRNGLVVVPTGINSATGEPAFAKTLGQEDDNGGLPGGLDLARFGGNLPPRTKLSRWISVTTPLASCAMISRPSVFC